MKRSRWIVFVVVLVAVAVTAAVWSRTRPQTLPPKVADEIARKLPELAWGHAKDWEAGLKDRTVTVWVEDAADYEAMQAKLIAAAALGPTNRSVGYNGTAGMYRLAPVDDVEAFV